MPILFSKDEKFKGEKKMNRKGKWLSLFFMMILVTNLVFSMCGEGVQADIRYDAVDAIPADAIRLRILANSDSIADQALKRKVRDAVAKHIHQWVKDYETKEEAAKVIEEKIPEIQAVIQDVMNERNQVQPFTIELTPTEFPTKLYGNQLYEAGTYDSLKIVLGEGAGANWWCVLFPPLCFLDFSSSSIVTEEEAKSSEEEVNHTEAQEVEVKFFFLKWFE